MKRLPWQYHQDGSHTDVYSWLPAPIASLTNHEPATDESETPTVSAPPAHTPWGPEYWPEAVRENVTVWPPPFRERQLIDDVCIPLAAPMCVTVMSRKNGVGKSTITRLLEVIYATHRADDVVIVDANPPETRTRGKFVQPATVRHTQAGRAVQASRVDAEDDAERDQPYLHEVGLDGVRAVVERVAGSRIRVMTPPAGDDDYAAFLDLLQQHYSVVICDVGVGISSAIIDEILSRTTVVVMVATPSLDGVYAATSSLAWIAERGFTNLAAHAIVCVNRIRSVPFSTLVTISRYFQRSPRTVVRIPWDWRLEEQTEIPQMDELLPTTRTGLFELAAAITTQACATYA